jgi:hypothetical protein
MTEIDTSLEIDSNTSSTCEINGVIYHPPQYPTSEEFYEDLNGYAIALYSTSSLTVIILGIQYFILIRRCLWNVSPKRRVATLWIWSVYLVASIIGLLGIVTPKSSDFVWLSYRVYLGLVMTYFVELTISWHGGQKEMVRRLEGKTIDMRVRPCCCIVCLPNGTPFSRNKIHVIKACVYQLGSVQTGLVFLLVVLNLSGDSTLGSMSPDDPNLYISIILLLSFFTGMWGLLTLFGVETTYEFLKVYQYRKKARFLKTIILCTNLQGFIIDSLTNYAIIPCAGPMISSKAMGSIIKSILTMFETLLLGSAMFTIYMVETPRVVEDTTQARRTLMANDDN